MFDAKPSTRRLLIDHPSTTNAAIRSEPHSIIMPLAHLVVQLQEDAVKRIGDAVRDIEQSRISLCPKANSPQTNICNLHDLARHAVHVLKTLDLITQTFKCMTECPDQAHSGLSSPPAVGDNGHAGNDIQSFETTCQDQDAHGHLRYYQGVIRALHLRSIANKDGLQNEIQYSFNIVAQNIARSSNEIQDTVPLDSSVMKMATLASAAFIPMTFVAKLFGMQFFAYSESGT